MRMCHRLKVVPILVCMAIALMCSPLKAAAAEATAKEYTVTFRPGNIAEFSEKVIQEYIEHYGADKVSISQVTGSISITVKAGSPYPEAPGPDDIILDEEHMDKYYVTTSWRPSDEFVMEDQDYVADYAALVDTVEYAVRYVDAQSGMDVAAPVISLGNVGDEVTFTAKRLADYSYDTYSKQMVLEEGKENTITFYYTSTLPPKYETVELEGQTIYNTITITKDPVRIVAGETDDTHNDIEAEFGGAGADVAGNQSETEDQEEKTQESDSINTEDEQGSNNPGQGNEQDEVIIEDEDIPLAAFLDENESAIGFIAAGLIGVAIILIIIAYIIKKKERKEE